jgi:Raf kinase inhibitor-like YbhB/YbcL family protein
MNARPSWAIVLVCVLASACGSEAQADPDSPDDKEDVPMSTLRLQSSAFDNNGTIPTVHTCEGKDQAPPLSFGGAPHGTESFALILDDPDAPDPAAPKRVWVHWVIYDLPKDTTSLPLGGALPSGARNGKNDWDRTGYGGPCPPVGRHRYFHKLYALDKKLGDLHEPTKAALEKAMQGHILGKAELVGTYQKTK